MAESEEELKSLLMKVKESEKVDLKLNFQKTKIMAFGPITTWQTDGETVETVADFIFLGSKITAAAAAKSLQSCPGLCDPIDGSPLGSYVPGILQARILEWVAISFSNA